MNGFAILWLFGSVASVVAVGLILGFTRPPLGMMRPERLDAPPDPSDERIDVRLCDADGEIDVHAGPPLRS